MAAFSRKPLRPRNSRSVWTAVASAARHRFGTDAYNLSAHVPPAESAVAAPALPAHSMTLHDFQHNGVGQCFQPVSIQKSVLTPSLNPAFSPRRRSHHRRFSDWRKTSGQSRRTTFQKRGERLSLSAVKRGRGPACHAIAGRRRRRGGACFIKFKSPRPVPLPALRGEGNILRVSFHLCFIRV
jgi:hypothetical protein